MNSIALKKLIYRMCSDTQEGRAAASLSNTYRKPMQGRRVSENGNPQIVLFPIYICMKPFLWQHIVKCYKLQTRFEISVLAIS